MTNLEQIKDKRPNRNMEKDELSVSNISQIKHSK